MNRWLVVAVGWLVPAVVAAAGGERVFPAPSDDRWHYPFNFSPGARPFASVFGSTSDQDYTTFNDRDAIFLVAWRTHEDVPMGLGPLAYDVQSVRVTLICPGASIGNPTGPTWPVDLTTDPWFNMDYPITDADPGQPIELFGVGFGPVYSSANWFESSPYVGGDDFELSARDPFPFIFDGSPLTAVHVEDSVKRQFTPTPWAIGTPQGYTPGNQRTPFPVHFDVNLSLSDGRVRRYFQDQLSAGRVFAAVTSLAVTYLQAPSGYPLFYTKEGAAIDPAGAAPVLRITLVPSGDIDGDERRALDDFRVLRDCLDGPGAAPTSVTTTTERCLFLFDFDEDADVDSADAATFFRRFTGGG